ncbi:MAG TPA: ABC transporter permease [Magnetospirillaceae bacterium]|jgi:phospholipid/cholesterol/gamma-HCH transport system permease protein
MPADGAGQYELDLSQAANGLLRVQLAGTWHMADGLPSADPLRGALGRLNGSRRVAFEAGRVKSWDSALVTFVLQLLALSQEADAAVDLGGLPEGLRRLVALATAVPERKDAARTARHLPLVPAIGRWAINFAGGVSETLDFLGQFMTAFGRFLRGQASFRRSDFLLYAQECGAQALPIVTVISILLGLILAFVGAVQLKQFGADVYVANLVVVAMSREMAAVMTAIVLAGRTGAAYAAQIGAMQGNEEIDALTTLGISPVEFLVLPRMLALVLMTPLLCIYSNLMGLIGGYAVAMGMLNVTGPAYLHQTINAAHLSDFTIGIAKSAVFGTIIAFAGCLKGIKSGRSAASVGDAATAAVVAGILYIIISDGIFAVILNFLGI